MTRSGRLDKAINQEDPGKHNPRAKGWFDKVREFFGQ